jgi:hypothetical protein
MSVEYTFSRRNLKQLFVKRDDLQRLEAVERLLATRHGDTPPPPPPPPRPRRRRRRLACNPPAGPPSPAPPPRHLQRTPLGMDLPPDLRPP